MRRSSYQLQPCTAVKPCIPSTTVRTACPTSRPFWRGCQVVVSPAWFRVLAASSALWSGPSRAVCSSEGKHSPAISVSWAHGRENIKKGTRSVYYVVYLSFRWFDVVRCVHICSLASTNQVLRQVNAADLHRLFFPGCFSGDERAGSV